MRFWWTGRPWCGLQMYLTKDKKSRSLFQGKWYVTFYLQGRKGILRGGLQFMYKEQTEVRTQQMNYLDGLRRFKDKGVAVLIDGIECLEEEWNRIFETGEDGGFYMGDFICSEQGRLKEIRFDRVYLTAPGKIGR